MDDFIKIFNHAKSHYDSLLESLNQYKIEFGSEQKTMLNRAIEQMTKYKNIYAQMLVPHEQMVNAYKYIKEKDPETSIQVPDMIEDIPIQRTVSTSIGHGNINKFVSFDEIEIEDEQFTLLTKEDPMLQYLTTLEKYRNICINVTEYANIFHDELESYNRNIIQSEYINECYKLMQILAKLLYAYDMSNQTESFRFAIIDLPSLPCIKYNKK